MIEAIDETIALRDEDEALIRDRKDKKVTKSDCAFKYSILLYLVFGLVLWFALIYLRYHYKELFKLLENVKSIHF